MKTTRTRFRSIALVLAMATVFLTSSFTVVAEDIIETIQNEIANEPNIIDYNNSNGIVEELLYTDESVYHYAVNEIPDRREENVKHFYMPDGTYKAVAYADAVHRQDATGAWKDIDNSLSLKAVSGTNKYSTSDGRVTFAPVFTYNGNVMTLTENGYSVSMAMAGSLPDHISTQNVPLTVTDAGVNRNEQLGWHSIDEAKNIDTSSSVRYANVAAETDLEYILTGNDIKENIIVKAPQSSYEYTFILTLSGLTATLEGDGSVTLSDAESDEEIYFIPAPYMYDAAGNTSHSVSYSLLTIKDEIYALTVTADSEWINAEGRAFPITVDPTINSARTCVCTYIDAENPGYTPALQSVISMVPESTYFLVKHTLPTLPDGAIMRKVEFSMFCYFSPSNTGNVYSCIRPIVQDWNYTNISWDSINLNTFLGSNLVENTHNIGDINTSAFPEKITIDITEIMNPYYGSTTQPFYGVSVNTDSDYNLYIMTNVYSMARSPYYTITYTDNIQDGVYSLQNMGTMTWTTIGDTSLLPGSPLQQVDFASDPVNTFNRQGLFKITNCPGTDRYIIRSMINNKMTIGFSSNGIITKEIPAYDGDVSYEDTFLIEYGLDGLEIRSSDNLSIVLSVDCNTMELTTVPETSIGMCESWMITKYTGSDQYGFYLEYDTESISVNQQTVITPFSWSTKPDYNYPVICVNEDNSMTCDWNWSALNHLYVRPLKSGMLAFELYIYSEAGQKHSTFRTYYVHPIEDGIYHINDGSSFMFMNLFYDEIGNEPVIKAVTCRSTLIGNNQIGYGGYLWKFERISNGVYKIVSLSERNSSTMEEDMVLTLSNDLLSEDESDKIVTTEPYSGSSAQKWRIINHGNYYTIENSYISPSYLISNTSKWETAHTQSQIYISEPQLPNSYFGGGYNSGVDVNGDLHIKVNIDSSVLVDMLITEETFEILKCWEDICDNIHIYLPGEIAPENVFEVTFTGVYSFPNYDDNVDEEEQIAAITLGGIDGNYSVNYTHLDWDSAQIQLNISVNGPLLNLTLSTYQNVIKKTIVHEMGHALKLSHTVDAYESNGFANQQTILSIMNQGNPYDNNYVLICPGFYDEYSLNKKWGW